MSTSRPLVLIESPYAGDVQRNTSYAQAALMDSIARGECPMAGHLLYTQVLDDSVEGQRLIGISLHLAWMEHCSLVALYVDFGTTRGMQEALVRAAELDKPIDYRRILP